VELEKLAPSNCVVRVFCDARECKVLPAGCVAAEVHTGGQYGTDIGASRGSEAYLAFPSTDCGSTVAGEGVAKAQFDFLFRRVAWMCQYNLRGGSDVPRQVDLYLGEALGQEFVRRTFSQTKAKTQTMTLQIEDGDATRDTRARLDGTGDEERGTAKDAHDSKQIGYPETWRDYSALTIKRTITTAMYCAPAYFEKQAAVEQVGQPVDRLMGMTPPTVNAYFNSSMNDINFPAGVLQLHSMTKDGRCTELWQHWVDDRPRVDAWIRR